MSLIAVPGCQKSSNSLSGNEESKVQRKEGNSTYSQPFLNLLLIISFA